MKIIRRNALTGALILSLVFFLVLFCATPQATAESNLTTIMKAAEQGDAEAQFNLGGLYADGDGVPQDDKQAVDWYRKAAEQGYADAQNNLGVMYAKGRGVPQDDKQAAEWYKKAAEQGDAYAQASLSVKYAYGEGVPQDDKQAVEWCIKAAGQGYAGAQTLLGAMYSEGRGIPQDDKQAVEWYRKAAEQGDAEAQDYLEAPEKAKLIRQAIETQQALHEIFKSDEPLPPDLAELCSTRDFKNSFDLIHSFSSWAKNLDDAHTANGDKLDLSTAKHLAIALHAWAFWYEEVLGLSELQVPYWPMVVIKDRPRNQSNVYSQFWEWRAKLRDADKKARSLVEETQDNSSVGTATKLLSPPIVAGAIKLKEHKKDVASLDAATNIYEKNRLITVDIPKEWEEMLSDYIAVEDGFYEMIDDCKTGASGDGQKTGAILDKIIAHYAKAKDYDANRESLALLKKYQTLEIRYFREVHKLARHEILDLPTTDLSYYWHLKFKRSANNWYVNKLPGMGKAQKAQKLGMRSAALELSTMNQFQAHCVFDFEKSAILRWVGSMKDYYSPDEYAQLVGQAKMKTSWYNMSQRLTTPIALEDKK